jgi:hypothetical protein
VGVVATGVIDPSELALHHLRKTHKFSDAAAAAVAVELRRVQARTVLAFGIPPEHVSSFMPTRSVGVQAVKKHSADVYDRLVSRNV